MIRGGIVPSVSPRLQELLLRRVSLDLKTAIEISRAYEITSRNKKEMNTNSETQEADKADVQSKFK